MAHSGSQSSPLLLRSLLTALCAGVHRGVKQAGEWRRVALFGIILPSTLPHHYHIAWQNLHREGGIRREEGEREGEWERGREKGREGGRVGKREGEREREGGWEEGGREREEGGRVRKNQDSHNEDYLTVLLTQTQYREMFHAWRNGSEHNTRKLKARHNKGQLGKTRIQSSPAIFQALFTFKTTYHCFR